MTKTMNNAMIQTATMAQPGAAPAAQTAAPQAAPQLATAPQPAGVKTATGTKPAADNARTEVVFVLDRSGSMGGREADVIGNFNKVIADQKRRPGECTVSVVLFDDTAEVLLNRVPLADVRDLTERDYDVRGCTAYYDALGRAIRHHVRVQRHLPKERRAEKVLFVVMTDGLENASREYSGAALRRLLAEEQRKWGWEFLFFGADIDAIEAAQHIGIKAENAISMLGDSQGYGVSYACVGSAIANVRERRAMSQNADGTSYRATVDHDYAVRSKR